MQKNPLNDKDNIDPTMQSSTQHGMQAQGKHPKKQSAPPISQANPPTELSVAEDLYKFKFIPSWGFGVLGFWAAAGGVGNA